MRIASENMYQWEQLYISVTHDIGVSLGFSRSQWKRIVDENPMIIPIARRD